MSTMRSTVRAFLAACLVLGLMPGGPGRASARAQSFSGAQVFSATLLENGRLRLTGENLERVERASLQGDGLFLAQSLGIAVPAGAVPPVSSLDLWAKSLIALVPGRAYTIDLDTLDGPVSMPLLIAADPRDELTPTVLDVSSFKLASDPDDTEAFRRAAASAAIAPRGSAHHIIYLRPRVYRVSGSISLGSEARVLSHGHAIITQACASCVTFDVPAAEDVRIEGIGFTGGSNHVSLRAEPGVDVKVLIDRCEFQGSSGPAILATGDQSSGLRSLFVDRSRFMFPRQALETSFDQTWVRDSWLAAGENTAFFVSRAGTLVLDNVLGNPVFGTGASRKVNARWVDNYGSFYAVAARFGGEDAGGPIVRHYAERSTEPQTVAILNSQVSAGGLHPGSAVVTLADNTVPHRLWLAGTYYLAGSPFVLGAPLDQTLVDAMDLVIEGYLALGVVNPVPNSMLRVLQQDTGREFELPIAIRPSGVTSPTPIAWPGVVDVTAYGAVGDGLTDDTEAIRRAAQAAIPFGVDAGPTEPGVTMSIRGALPLFFPAGDYRISGPINLHVVDHVFGAGRPTITQTSGTSSIFVASYSWVASFSGLNLVGGGSQILFSNCNLGGSELIVDRMEFQGAGRMSVEAFTPACDRATNDGHLSTNLVVGDSTFYSNAAILRNVGDKASLRNSLVFDCPWCRLPEKPAIENIYGGLTIQNSAFVDGYALASSRWINNNGYIVIDASSFVGEDMSIVAEVVRPTIDWIYDGPYGPLTYRALSPAENVYPFMGTVVAMDQIEASSVARPSGVLLLDGHVPGLFRLVGARGASAATTVSVADSFVDLASNLRRRRNPCRYTFSDAAVLSMLPIELQDFLAYSRSAAMRDWNPF